MAKVYHRCRKGRVDNESDLEGFDAAPMPFAAVFLAFSSSHDSALSHVLL